MELELRQTLKRIHRFQAAPAALRDEGVKERSRKKNSLAAHGLIDVSSYAKAIGFLVPVLIDRKAWETFVWVKDDVPLMERNPRMKERRLLDILLQALHAARNARRRKTARFNMYRLTSENERRRTGRVAIRGEFRVHCGPGDSDEPVVTIKLA